MNSPKPRAKFFTKSNLNLHPRSIRKIGIDQYLRNIKWWFKIYNEFVFLLGLILVLGVTLILVALETIELYEEYTTYVILGMIFLVFIAYVFLKHFITEYKFYHETKENQEVIVRYYCSKECNNPKYVPKVGYILSTHHYDFIQGEISLLDKDCDIYTYDVLESDTNPEFFI